MIEPINHTGNIASPGSYKPLTSMPVERNDSNVKRDIAKTSSKYILENKGHKAPVDAGARRLRGGIRFSPLFVVLSAGCVS
jgi:hypothetical protein